MWSLLVCIVDQNDRQIGGQFFSYFILPFYNKPTILTDRQEQRTKTFFFVIPAEEWQILRSKR